MKPKAISRYDRPSELAVMAEAIATLTGYERWITESIFCDSKACDSYTVQLALRAEADALRIGDKLDEAFIKLRGGHNGVMIKFEEEVLTDVDPNWPDLFKLVL